MLKQGFIPLNDDAPATGGDRTATFNEDTTYTLTTSDLNATDIENASTQFTYTISNLTNGTLLVNGVSSTTFTQSQINSGLVKYTPNANYNGSAGFDFTVSDGITTTSNTMNFTINTVNDAPTLTTLSKIGTEDTTLTFATTDFTSVYSDIEGIALNSIRINTLATNGTLRLSGVAVTAGQIITSANIANLTFVPNANYNGTANFTWSATDGTTYSSSSTANLNINAVNDIPVVGGDKTAAFNEDTTYTLTTSDLNATDVDNTSAQLTYTISSLTNGTLLVNGISATTFTQADIIGGLVKYTPNANYNGSAGFDFSVSDTDLVTSSNTMNFTINPINDAPIISALTKTTDEDTTLTFSSTDFTSLYSDAEGTALNSIKINTLATNGTLKLSGTNVTTGQVISSANIANLTFVPNANYNGTANFTWSATDGTTYSSTNTDTLTINALNDAPVVGGDKTATLNEAATYTLTKTDLGATDVDNTSSQLTYTISSLTNSTLLVNGISATTFTQADITGGLVKYTPNANYNGSAGFDFSVSDGALTTTSNTMNFNITPVNDAPTLTALSKAGVEATTLTFTTTDFTSHYTDIESTALNSIRIDTLATNGTLRLSGVAVTAGQVITSANIANLTFAPTANFNGTANFTWSASDGTAYSATPATATLTISAVNDTPTLTALSKAGVEDTTLTFATTDFTSQYSDAEGTALNSIRIDSLATNGTLRLSGTAVTAGQVISSANIANLTFVPNANYNGTANFTWSATDGTAYSATPATATLTISAVNDAPTLTALSKAGVEDTTLTFTATDFTSKYSDIEGTALNSIRIDSLATNGTLRLSGVAVTAGQVITSANIANLTFAPTANFNGTANFTWSATDGTAYSATPATATLTISAVNDAPIIAGDLKATVNDNGRYILTSSDLGATDIDSASSSFTYTISGLVNSYGTLQTWNGSAWVIATTFTQAQLAAGQVSFVDAGYNFASVSFAVNVSDGALTSANSTFTTTTTLLNNINSDDFLVHTIATGVQQAPQITSLSNGGFVTTWMDSSLGSNDIRARVFDANGTANGNDFLVSTTNTNNQDSPQITILSNGGFVITWADNSSGNYDIRARIFNAAGTAVNATDFLVSTTNTNNQLSQQITSLSNGGFVATWQDNSSGNNDIRARVFSANGTAVNATDFLVSTTTTSFWQQFPQITSLSNGGFVVTWMDGNIDGNDNIKARVFGANGTPVTANDFLVSTTNTGSQTSPQITDLSNGGFVVTWHDNSSGNYDIRARVFSANGTPVNATDFLVSTTNTNNQLAPEITSLSNGGFVVTWEDESSGNNDIRARVFNANGTAVTTSDFLVDNVTTGWQTYNNITSLSNNGFVATYTEYVNSTNSYDVKARVFDANGNPLNIGTTGNDVFVSDSTNQTVNGNIGNDFYVFRGAFGNDVINDTGGTDRLDLMNFAYADYFSRTEGGTVGDNLVITLTGGTITIVNYFTETGNIAGTGYIEAIDFWNTQNVIITNLTTNGWV